MPDTTPAALAQLLRRVLSGESLTRVVIHTENFTGTEDSPLCKELWAAADALAAQPGAAPTPSAYQIVERMPTFHPEEGSDRPCVMERADNADWISKLDTLDALKKGVWPSRAPQDR